MRVFAGVSQREGHRRQRHHVPEPAAAGRTVPGARPAAGRARHGRGHARLLRRRPLPRRGGARPARQDALPHRLRRVGPRRDHYEIHRRTRS